MRVAVAVSGGADSVALLHLLVSTRALHGATLSVVHVDHAQSTAAVALARVAAEAADALGLPYHEARIEVGPGASEATLRRERYAVLASLDVERVALAHHADDQAETVLLNLLRGTGPAGLQGMPHRRGRYVRPVLSFSRADLRSWAATAGVTWVEDPANRSERFLRNRIRHDLIPRLEDLRPGAVAALARSATAAAADHALLDSLASELGLDLASLQEAPVPLVARRIRQLLPSLTTARLDAVLAIVRRGRGAVELGGGRRVVARHHRLVVEGDSTGHPG
jgi:tRNA(Ile)-lysidine synthase